MRKQNSQFFINMTASLVTFFVGVGIRFGLTPYIVRTLGPEAYGFIGLSANILSYTSLITIALNSMAGRFITITYCSDEVEEANKYYASVFFSNVFLSVAISLVVSLGIFFLELFLNIPQGLVFDVKLLFVFLLINNVIGLISGTWAVSTFIKNRLDLSNLRIVVGNIINALVLIFLFSFFSPHVWYIGVGGLMLTIYTAITNYRFMGSLTPELVLKKANVEWTKIKNLVQSGIWNLISKLGELFGQGLDLLIANLCIGTVEMGYFAITKNVPFLILGLFQSISSVFAPTMTRLYAQKKEKELVDECHKSIRVLSLFTAIPLTCLYIYGDSFYSLWIPSEDAHKLLFLTILGTFALPYTLPLESLWNIFTITNKLKYSTLFMLGNNIVVFLIVLCSMFVVESHEMRLYILAGTRSLCGVIRGFVFLPIYGSICLGLSKVTFYKSIFLSLFYIGACLILCHFGRFLFIPKSWVELTFAFIFVSLISFVIGFFLVLSKKDRVFFIKKSKRCV